MGTDNLLLVDEGTIFTLSEATEDKLDFEDPEHGNGLQVSLYYAFHELS